MKPAFYLTSLALLAACTSSSSPEQKFALEGVSFTCPAGWKLDTTGLHDDPNSRFVSCEKQGLNSSGLVTLGWVKDSVELSEALSIQQDGLRNNVIFKNSNLQFGPVTDTEYHGHPAKMSPYTFNLLGVKHEGMIRCCYGPHKTVFFVQQQALEDKAANAAGLATLEQTFTW
jgi:hypothetical protein